MDCRCCQHHRARRAWFQQPAPPTSCLFAHFRLSRSDTLPRWRLLAPRILSFKNALQKPTCDITDTTSIFFFTVYDSCTQRHAEHAVLIFKLHFCGLLFTDTSPYCIFFINIFFFFFTHNTTQHPKYNKTKQQTHTQHLKVQSKGRERGKDNKNTKVTPLYNHVYQTKNTAKHQWSKAWPHQLAPLHIHKSLFAGGYRSNMFFHTCAV